MSTHTANQNQTKQSQNQNQDDRRIPKRSPARILWAMSLEEWRQFQDGDLSADELKRRYGTGETGGDAA
jgi:hypothetical protein